MGIDYNNFSTEDERRRILREIQEKYGDELKSLRESEKREEKGNREQEEPLPVGREGTKASRNRYLQDEDPPRGRQPGDPGTRSRSTVRKGTRAEYRPKGSGVRSSSRNPQGKRSAGGRFGIALGLIVRRVTSLRISRFTRSFRRKMKELYIPALESVYHEYEDIMVIDPDFGERVWDRLRQDDILYVELLRELESLYDPDDLRDIIRYMDNYPGGAPGGLRYPILRLYQKLYFLRYNHTALANAFRRMYYHWGALTGRDPAFQAREVRENLDILVNGLLPRLHYLFCLYADEHYRQNDERVPERLGELLAPVPGEYEDLDSVYLDAAESLLGNRETALEEEGHPAPAETENSAPAAVQQDESPGKEGASAAEKGSAIHPVNEGDQEREPELKPGVDMERLAGQYDREGTTEGVDTANRLVPLFLLFRKFYQEYSFVLGSARIQYTDQETKNSMLDLFHETTRLNEELGRYIRELKRDNENDNRDKDGNYYRKALEEDAARSRLKREGIDLRNRVRVLMERVLGQLSPVNVDLNDTAGLVANPYNAIEFESFEAGRELDGATVKQALEDTEAFVRDFLQRFEDGGEFAGGLEVSQEEYRARYREAREELKAREEEARESIQEKRAEVQEELKRENQRLREELEKLKKEKEQERERLEKEKLEELKEQGLQENDSRVAEELAGIRTMMEKKFEKQRKHYEKMLARYRAQLQKEIEELKKRKKEEYDELRQYLMQELDHLKKGRKPAGKTLIDYRTGKDDKALKEIEEVRKDIWNFEEELLHLMMERFQEAFGGSWERHLENYRIMDKIMERRNKENRDREHEGNPYNLLEVASLGEKLDIIGKKKFWEPLFSHVFRYLGEDPKSTRDFFNKHSRELTSLRNDLYHPRLTVDQGKLRIGRAAMERLWESLKRYRHEKQASRTN